MWLLEFADSEVTGDQPDAYRVAIVVNIEALGVAGAVARGYYHLHFAAGFRILQCSAACANKFLRESGRVGGEH